MRVAISRLCGCATGLACLLAGASAEAEIQFCNEFPHLVYVAMAYPQNEGSWISRGWISLNPRECSFFDPALRVKTFYYRGESENYREGGRRIKTNWGAGRKFAIREAGNFNYWDAQDRVLDSRLAEFTHAGEETKGDSISVIVTFKVDGSSVTIK